MRRSFLLLLAVLLSIVPAALAQLTPKGEIAVPDLFSAVADVNGDGLDDLVDGNSIRLNLGGGTFAAPFTVVMPQSRRIVGTLDFNGDGLADLIAFDSPPAFPPSFGVPPAPPKNLYRLYRNDGGGVFIDLGPLPMDGAPYAVTSTATARTTW